MDESQPDDQPAIQDFLRWNRSEETQSLGCGGPGNDLNRRYLSRVKLEKYFSKRRVNRILEALFTGQERQVPDAESIINHYLRPFAILLCIGFGRMIRHFWQHKSLQDHLLPFHTPPHQFPSSTMCNLFEKFCREQWCFCAVKFDYKINCHLATAEIIPITQIEKIDEGGSAIIYKITVDRDYDDLVPPNIKNSENEDHPRNTYVLKTYRTRDAKTYYENEVDAFRKLRWKGMPHQNIIAFYGSFVRGETYNIIQEYADLGNLDRYMESTSPPLRLKDKIIFFDRFFEVMNGLVRIHGEEESKAKGPHSLLGWHQDVNPTNILVKSRKGGNSYDCDFKLGDLGLSHFKKYVSPLGDATDQDTFGTYAYGAPESCRSNPKIEQSNLQVKQVVDVWSMGCVQSEVAVWVYRGWSKVAEYRRRRAEEMVERTGTKEDCFHISGAILRTVNDIHQDIMENSGSDDYITPIVLSDLVLEMLVGARSRPTAKLIYEKSRLIIKNANSQLDRAFSAATATTDYSVLVPQIVKNTKRKSPPNLPPDHNRHESGEATRRQTPYSSEKPWSLDESPFIDDNVQMTSCSPSIRASPNDCTLYQTGLYKTPVFRPKMEVGAQIIPRDESRVVSGQSHIKIRAQRTQSLHIDSGNNRLDAENKENVIGFSRGPRSRTMRYYNDTSSAHSFTNSIGEGALQDTTTGEPVTLLTKSLSPHNIPKQSLPHERIVTRTPSASTKILNRKPPPAMSVEFGLVLKRIREQGVKHNFPHEELFGSLENRDHVFLIDNSESMAVHHHQVKRLLELLSYMVQLSVPDGLDLYFTTCPKKLRPRSNSKILQELDNKSAFGAPDMRERFANIVENYRCEFEKKNIWDRIWHSTRRFPRKFSLYVFTDGVWQPKTTLIREVETLVEFLIDHKLTNKQIGIQFIRFGDDPTGIARLDKLDSGLGLKLDVIDTTPADGNVWKMLLGALNDWFDSDGENKDEDDVTSPGED